MMRSLFSAVSAIRNHQAALDVIANNLANVNTNGFKAGRANFQDTLYQTISGASAPGGAAETGSGGLNPSQIGLGMRLGGIDTLQTQGSMQNTGRASDLAIQGNGFFVMSDQGGTSGTGTVRIAYTRDGAFDLDANGRLVNPNTGFVVQGYAIPTGSTTAPAGAPLGPITIPPNTYNGFAVSSTGVVTGYTSNGTAVPLAQVAIANVPNPSGLLHIGNNMFLWTPAAGGAPAGAQGAPDAAQQIAAALSAVPQTAGRGEIAAGALEMSNVDIAGQMSGMIVMQRGFQANTRVVTTSDEMLQELMTLKR